ncbi:DUF3306 domain-containing protein [Alisedimentitalea sp. MJ-SS2]|uniref:DUF3306 domain-containing protein n=1 Tax=Aliisedimentitalea sp. MJ-SS2 TaxID=3049795 RepID=UPI00290B0144|nr:DUF3306 domain-containing protein [Alisedimentitalea sp. MJ-SS2]MDU8929357.1 DUF3306 domain-containing protein [Alisedimentitalea sp. MJ-SS2]
MSGGRDFWTRRRAAVEAETLEEQRLEEAAATEARETELAERPDEEILKELGLPDPDTLEKGDDFKVFLTETVPARIRTRALRRLWGSNPILANVDGLVDYGEDFTDAACAIENLQTAYQVGKGMTAHVDELARQAAESEAIEDEVGEHDVDDEFSAEVEVGATEAGPEPIRLEEPEDILVAAEASASEHEPDEAPSPIRRMRFRFEPEGAEA